MTSITFTAGGKPGAYRGEEGSFAATLITHSIEGPFTSKQDPTETFKLHEWGFDIEGAAEGESMVWITSGVENTGPKSKTYGITSALIGGKPIPTGTTLDIETHLIGRQALVSVQQNDRGYLDCVGVTVLPKAMQKGALPQQAPAPVVEAIDASLPF